MKSIKYFVKRNKVRECRGAWHHANTVEQPCTLFLNSSKSVDGLTIRECLPAKSYKYILQRRSKLRSRTNVEPDYVPVYVHPSRGSADVDAVLL